MTTFFIGIIILVVGGYFYGAFCEKTFGPDDRETPAITKADGVDFVAMKQWKNALVNLLNIAGTGPVLGPIQGILFGPVAFITIPIGCVIAGSMHDYFAGMISMRNGGAQMPKLIRKYLGETVFKGYNIIVWILMMLVGVVFVYTPGDLIVKELIGQAPEFTNPTTWIVYVAIFIYYLVATLFPIDAIIGRIYPIFGAILIISAVGIFGGIVLGKGAALSNLSLSGNIFGMHPQKLPFIPTFFITVACGILSGFHATQNTLIARTVKSEKEGRMTFFNMMLVEGFIAMCWAAGAMILFNTGTDMATTPTLMVGLISRDFLGNIGGVLAILGVIVLPITSGDTAFRGLRLMIAEQFNIDQQDYKKRVSLTLGIFIPAFAILIWAKSSPGGFNVLWRYFAFTNQFVGIFALAMEAIFLYIHGKNYIIPLVPGAFYCFITTSFILHAPIGFGLEQRILGDPNSYVLSYAIAAVLTVGYIMFVRKHSSSQKDKILQNVLS
jgi:carbon starvation protein CstA